MKYVPNALTIARILVTPLVLFLLFSDSLTGRAWALGLFVAASISDYLDGKVARHFQVGTSLGQYLDPFADKVLVLGTFVVLIFVVPEIVPIWAVALIAIRDLSVTILRSWTRHRGYALRTSRSAKLKTTFQLTFLILLLLLLTLEQIPGRTGPFFADILSGPWLFWFMVIVVIVTLFTGIQYFIRLRQSPESSASSAHE